MAKGKARGFEALMGWLSGRGVDPDQAEALLRSLPNVDSMTPTDLQRVIDQMNAPAPRARMDSPVSVEDRVAGNPQTGMRPDPNIRSTLQELDPEFSSRIDTASPEEIMAAYRNAVNRAEGVRRGAPRQSPARVMDTPVASVPPPQGPVRQMELPLGPGAPEPNIRELLSGRLPPGMTGDRVAAHNSLRDSWPGPEDLEPEDLAAFMAELSPLQRQYLQALEKNNWLGFDYPSQAASAGLALPDAPRRWEMSPELLAARQALIDGYPRGPGVPGELSGPGQILTRQLDMIPAPLRGLPAPSQRRLGTTAGVPMGPSSMPVIDVPFEMVQPARRLTDNRPPAPGVPSRAATAADELIDGPSPGMRASQPEVPRPVDDGPKMPWGSLAGGLGLGLGLSQMMPEDAFKTPPASGSGPKNATTADLAEESRPAPKVEVTEETPQPTVKQGPPDYSSQARQLIARANDIQRQAGRQTPESIALINQANRLYEMAAEGRRNGSQPAIMPVEQQNQQTSSIQRNAQEQVAQNQGTDYRSQARRMMAELNIRSSQGNISSAEYSATKRRIDELFALADQEDNARRNPSQRDRRPNTGGGMGRVQFPPTRRLQTRRSPSTT